jgi:hypothetical protein
VGKAEERRSGKAEKRKCIRVFLVDYKLELVTTRLADLYTENVGHSGVM